MPIIVDQNGRPLFDTGGVPQPLPAGWTPAQLDAAQQAMAAAAQGGPPVRATAGVPLYNQPGYAPARPGYAPSPTNPITGQPAPYADALHPNGANGWTPPGAATVQPAAAHYATPEAGMATGNAYHEALGSPTAAAGAGQRPWWQNYSLGELASLPPQLLQALPPEAVQQFPNEVFVAHPELLSALSTQQFAGRGFAPDFAAQYGPTAGGVAPTAPAALHHGPESQPPQRTQLATTQPGQVQNNVYGPAPRYTIMPVAPGAGAGFATPAERVSLTSGGPSGFAAAPATDDARYRALAASAAAPSTTIQMGTPPVPAPVAPPPAAPGMGQHLPAPGDPDYRPPTLTDLRDPAAASIVGGALNAFPAVNTALTPLASGGDNGTGRMPFPKPGSNPYVAQPLGGVRPMSAQTLGALNPIDKQSMQSILQGMGNVGEGADYLDQATRAGGGSGGGPSVRYAPAASSGVQAGY